MNERYGACLDARKLRTTSLWIKNKLLPSQHITVIEKDPKTHASHKGFSKTDPFLKNIETPMLLLGTLNQHLPRLNNCNIVFFDYMGDYFGNSIKKQYPQQDIYEFLKHNENEKITLAITICPNPWKGPIFEGETREESTIQQLLQVVLPSTGYKISSSADISKKVYKSRTMKMLFLCLNVTKINPVFSFIANSIHWPIETDASGDLVRWIGFPKHYQESDESEENKREEGDDDTDEEEHDDENSDPMWTPYD